MGTIFKYKNILKYTDSYFLIRLKLTENNHRALQVQLCTIFTYLYTQQIMA